MNNNDKDPNKKTEEELKRLIEELKSRERGKRTFASFGFRLHHDYAVHLILSLGVNTLLLAVITGLSIAINEPLIHTNNLVGFVIAALMFTLIENTIKILVYRYAFKAVLYSAGLLSYAITLLVLYVVNLIMKNDFYFDNMLYLVIFTLGFSFFRVILTTYIRRWIYTKNIHLTGGKK